MGPYWMINTYIIYHMNRFIFHLWVRKIFLWDIKTWPALLLNITQLLRWTWWPPSHPIKNKISLVLGRDLSITHVCRSVVVVASGTGIDLGTDSMRMSLYQLNFRDTSTVCESRHCNNDRRLLQNLTLAHGTRCLGSKSAANELDSYKIIFLLITVNLMSAVW